MNYGFVDIYRDIPVDAVLEANSARKGKGKIPLDRLVDMLKVEFDVKGSATVAEISAMTGMQTGDTWAVSDSGTLPSGLALTAGDLVRWDGSVWKLILHIASASTWNGKADKVSGATNGNFAALDSNGNLTDSGKKTSDFEQVTNKVDAWQQTPDDTHYPSEKLVKDELDTKADKVTFEPGHNPDGNIPELDENGNLDDSGVAAADVVTNVLISGESTLVADHVAIIPKADDYSATIPAQGDTPEQPGTPSSWGVVQVSTIEL